MIYNKGMNYRQKQIIFGAGLGASLGLIYAVVGYAVNLIRLPGVPLLPPQGSLSPVLYLLSFWFSGALLGALAALPDSKWAGTGLGALGAGGMVIVLGLAVPSAGGSSFWRSIVVSIATFLPLVVLMAPLAYLIRWGVDVQEVDPDAPRGAWQRVGVPVLLAVMVALVGYFGAYDQNTRQALQTVNQWIRQSQEAGAPVEALQTVKGLTDPLGGAYRLGRSDAVDDFLGPNATFRDPNQFLVVAQFGKGFRFACVFVPGNVVPPYCTNF